MPKVIILGSSNAIASADHENTHMAVVGEKRTLLIDCVGSPVPRLERAGLDPNSVTDVITTHFHPDHISGLPLLIMDMWLMGRREPLNIYGLDYTLDRLQSLMSAYGWESWPNFYPVALNRLPAQEMAPVLDCPDFRVFSSPVHHLIPTIGLRIEFNPGGKVMAYSCDTEPCSEVVRLAAGADLLIHESAGKARGHSSAEQAGEVAHEAEVAKLYLIHYPTRNHSASDLLEEARLRYQGEVKLAEDFMVLDLT